MWVRRLVDRGKAPSAATGVVQTARGTTFFREAVPMRRPRVRTTSRKTPVYLVLLCLIALQSSVSSGSDIINNVLEMTPVTTPSPHFGVAKMWAKYELWDTDLWVMNSFGDSTLISPHRFELYQPSPEDELPWTFYSENCFIGKRTNVDISGAIRALEELTGKQFIYMIDLPEEKRVDAEEWVTSQTLDMIQRAKEYEIEKTPWIEVPLTEALEEVDEIVYENVVQTRRKYRVNLEQANVEGFDAEEEVVVARPTGRKVKRVKRDVQFVEETGKFFRRRTLDDVNICPDDLPEVRLPPYVTSRLESAKTVLAPAEQ